MSILDEIRNRTASKTVAERRDVFQEQSTSLTEQAVANDSLSDVVEVDTERVEEASPTSDLEKLHSKLAQFPKVASRVPVRLEFAVKEDIEAFCRQEKITMETLLEALYLTCNCKDTVMRQVAKEARKRLASRKAAGNIRSSITRLENITQE